MRRQEHHFLVLYQTTAVLPHSPHTHTTRANTSVCQWLIEEEAQPLESACLGLNTCFPTLYLCPQSLSFLSWTMCFIKPVSWIWRGF